MECRIVERPERDAFDVYLFERDGELRSAIKTVDGVTAGNGEDVGPHEELKPTFSMTADEWRALMHAASGGMQGGYAR